ASASATTWRGFSSTWAFSIGESIVPDARAPTTIESWRASPSSSESGSRASRVTESWHKRLPVLQKLPSFPRVATWVGDSFRHLSAPRRLPAAKNRPPPLLLGTDLARPAHGSPAVRVRGPTDPPLALPSGRRSPPMKLAAVPALLLAATLASSAPARAQRYDQVNLVSDLSGQALHMDSHLVNPWG